MRLELTRVGLLVELANHYTTRGACSPSYTVLVRRADSDFVSCPTFDSIAWTDHKLIRVSLRLANRPSLASYWKFNISLLEIRDFRNRLESRIKRALVGVVIENW